MEDFDWSAAEAELDSTEPEVEDASKLTDMELLSRFAAVDAELRNLSEMLHPRTDRGRELHSVRVSLKVNLVERGLM